MVLQTISFSRRYFRNKGLRAVLVSAESDSLLTETGEVRLCGNKHSTESMKVKKNAVKLHSVANTLTASDSELTKTVQRRSQR